LERGGGKESVGSNGLFALLRAAVWQNDGENPQNEANHHEYQYGPGNPRAVIVAEFHACINHGFNDLWHGLSPGGIAKA
jgi:hypothetical protein